MPSLSPQHATVTKQPEPFSSDDTAEMAAEVSLAAQSSSEIPRKNQLNEWLEYHHRPCPPEYAVASVTVGSHERFIGNATVVVADGTRRTFEAEDSATSREGAEALAAAAAYNFLINEHREGTHCRYVAVLVLFTVRCPAV